MELLADGNGGVVIVGRETPDDQAPLYAFRFDGAGKAGRQGRPRDRVRPPARGRDGARQAAGGVRPQAGHQGRGGHLHRRALRPRDAGARRQAARPQRRRRRRAQGAGVRLHRLLRRLHARAGERPGDYDKKADVRAAAQDGDHRRRQRQGGRRKGQIADIVGWAQTGQLRREHPGRSLFVELNDDGSGVDVVDAMGKKQPATLAVPLHLYDPKSLRVEEGPAAGQADVRHRRRSAQHGRHRSGKRSICRCWTSTRRCRPGHGQAARAGVHPPPGHLATARRHAGGAQALQELLPGRR